ncbi:metal ABC transporter substrate-binding protein [Betaproteobacteria bacterium]|nr:metal ABC transporter substrate-binding protein [Betaproteobacteria bacterium]GHT99186.1 metal ABC transporter substrate-binding protein [Betaproteobacteria bacterium]
MTFITRPQNPAHTGTVRHLIAGLSICLGLGLGLSLSPLTHAAELKVVTSFSLLADLVQEVGGERVDVYALVGPDENAHIHEPKPSDARRIGQARLVLANGLGFDDWLVRLARSSGGGHAVVIASEGINPLAMDDPHDDHAALDPHAWQDVRNVDRYVANIAAALIKVDPAGADLYRTRAARYRDELKALDADIRHAIAALPAERRRVVSSHDAFGYFAHAYGLSFLAPVGVSNDAEPTAKEVARLITQLRQEKAAAVFVENITDPRLIERIRIEGGAIMGGTLYADALSAADGPAPTYLKLMRHNLDTLMTALRR